MKNKQKNFFKTKDLTMLIFIVIFHLILNQSFAKDDDGPGEPWIPYVIAEAKDVDGPGEPWIPYVTAKDDNGPGEPEKLWTPENTVQTSPVDPDRPWQNKPMNKAIQNVQFTIEPILPDFEVAPQPTILNLCGNTAIDMRRAFIETQTHITGQIIQNDDDFTPYLSQIKAFNYQLLVLSAAEDLIIYNQEDRELISQLAGISIHDIEQMTIKQCDRYFSSAMLDPNIQERAIINNWFHFMTQTQHISETKKSFDLLKKQLEQEPPEQESPNLL